MNASQPVATTISSLARASKCSGLMKSSHFQSHRIKAIIVTTAETPECTAPITKYGAKIVECHPSTAGVTAKSHDTIECTETKMGSIRADRRMPPTVCSFHCLGLPLHPRDSTVYIAFCHPVVRSRRLPRSGSSAM